MNRQRAAGVRSGPVAQQAHEVDEPAPIFSHSAGCGAAGSPLMLHVRPHIPLVSGLSEQSPPPSRDTLFHQIRLLVAEKTGAPLERVREDTRLHENLKLYGDDIADLILSYRDHFGVDISNYRWYHHTGPEGCNPLWVFYRPWWSKKTHIPIRVADLVDGAYTGTWPIVYPEDEREER